MSKCPSCGFVLSEHAKARSSQDHRRFFGVINAAYHHWPEVHEFQPDSSEHLRSFLLCKAGYRTTTTIDCPDDADVRVIAAAAEAAVKAAGAHAFIRPHGSALAVFSAKSIAWDKLDQTGFHKIRDAVESVIRAETGLEPDDILKNTEAA